MAVVTRNAPAGADYTGNEGLIVFESAANEATLAVNPATEEPLGVIVAVEIAAVPQRLTIAGAGSIAKIRCGGVIPPGTRKVKTSGTSEGVVSPTNPAGATWQHTVGILIDPLGATTVNDGFAQILVSPTINLET
jgi:hypothetical protein